MHGRSRRNYLLAMMLKHVLNIVGVQSMRGKGWNFLIYDFLYILDHCGIKMMREFFYGIFWDGNGLGRERLGIVEGFGED